MIDKKYTVLIIYKHFTDTTHFAFQIISYSTLFTFRESERIMHGHQTIIQLSKGALTISISL
jgi:hypothetical protein